MHPQSKASKIRTVTYAVAIIILHTLKTHKKHSKTLLRLHCPKWSTPNDTDETKKVATPLQDSIVTVKNGVAKWSNLRAAMDALFSIVTKTPVQHDASTCKQYILIKKWNID